MKDALVGAPFTIVTCATSMVDVTNASLLTALSTPKAVVVVSLKEPSGLLAMLTGTKIWLSFMEDAKGMAR